MKIHARAAALALMVLFGCPNGDDDPAPCTGGQLCTPANACHRGAMDCASRMCVDLGTPLEDGASCGEQLVCIAGACVAPSTPVIASFSASPQTVARGTSVVLSWSVTGAAALTIDPGVGAVSGSSTSVTPGATTTYTLTATNAAGSTSASTTVTVSPETPPEAWRLRASLPEPRSHHSATLLPSGKVLVVGGSEPSNAVVYDPVGDRWDATGAMPPVSRDHAAALLPNGRVLVVDGPFRESARASLYDAETNTWTQLDDLGAVHFPMLGALQSGDIVLVAAGPGFEGGSCDPGVTFTYGGASGAWQPEAPIPNGRRWGELTVLVTGEVLVTGGSCRLDGSTTRLASLWTASAGWVALPPMATAREFHTATALPAGAVLVAGGSRYSGDGSCTDAAAELFDASTLTWAPTAAMTTSREGHTATLLPSRRVLVVGGDVGDCADGPPTWHREASAEEYDPATGTWSRVASMSVARRAHTATPLPSGGVLVVGGDEHGTVEEYWPR